MYPVLIGEGIWALPSYFTMLMLGFFIGALLARREAVRVGFDPVKVIDLSFAIVIASIVGARLAHGYLMDYVWLCFGPEELAKSLPNGDACMNSAQCVTAQNQGYNIGANCVNGQCIPNQDCLRPLMFWAGGLTYYGGFILAVLTSWFLAHRWKWSMLKLTDMMAPIIALGLAFGRLGCFLAGCCFGKVTDVPWAIRFPQYSDAWKRHREQAYDALVAQHEQIGEWLSLPVHPTQLYELFGSLILFAWLWIRRKKTAYRGQQLAILLIGYGILRFVIEFWRDDDRGGWLLSTSQWISIPLIAIGIVIAIWGRKKNRVDANNADETPDNSTSSEDLSSSNDSEKSVDN